MVVDGQGHHEAEEAVVQRELITAIARLANCWKTPRAKDCWSWTPTSAAEPMS